MVAHYPFPKMNIEKIATLLCSNRRLLQVLGELSPRAKAEIKDKLLQHAGLHLTELDREMAEMKEQLLEACQNGYESLAAVSIEHLCMPAREALDDGSFFDRYGILAYTNQFGGFLYFGSPETHMGRHDIPKSVSDLKQWATQREYVWVKIDVDALTVEGLSTYDTVDVLAEAA